MFIHFRSCNNDVIVLSTVAWLCRDECLWVSNCIFLSTLVNNCEIHLRTNIHVIPAKCWQYQSLFWTMLEIWYYKRIEAVYYAYHSVAVIDSVLFGFCIVKCFDFGYFPNLCIKIICYSKSIFILGHVISPLSLVSKSTKTVLFSQ